MQVFMIIKWFFFFLFSRKEIVQIYLLFNMYVLKPRIKAYTN